MEEDDIRSRELSQVARIDLYNYLLHFFIAWSFAQRTKRSIFHLHNNLAAFFSLSVGWEYVITHM